MFLIHAPCIAYAVHGVIFYIIQGEPNDEIQ